MVFPELMVASSKTQYIEGRIIILILYDYYFDTIINNKYIGVRFAWQDRHTITER